MVTVKFRKELAAQILAGRKTSTWRLFDDKNLATGMIVDFVEWESGSVFARVRILDVVVKRFDELTEADWEGHDRFSSDEEMYETFSQYYGRVVTSKTEVKILRFEVI